MPRHLPRPARTTAAAGATVLAVALSGPVSAAPAAPRVTLNPIGTYASGVFDQSGAEIVAHDPDTQRLFVVNATAGVDVLSIRNPANPTFLGRITTSGGVNSVDVRDGVLAVATQADPAQDPGTVDLFDTDGNPLAQVQVGALPDMLTFTPDGTKIVVANEGEPAGYCVGDEGDPEGTVSIIDVSGGAESVTQDDVRTADFTAFNGQAEALRAAGVRIFGPGATAAQDLEPEYVAIDAESSTAWVALQENNAFGIVDLASATVTDVVPLGFKDHDAPGNRLDASNQDDQINLRNWPVQGIYMPDGIHAYDRAGSTFIVTANEGDARDYDCFSEEARIAD